MSSAKSQHSAYALPLLNRQSLCLKENHEIMGLLIYLFLLNRVLLFQICILFLFFQNIKTFGFFKTLKTFGFMVAL